MALLDAEMSSLGGQQGNQDTPNCAETETEVWYKMELFVTR